MRFGRGDLWLLLGLALAQPPDAIPPPADFMVKSWSMADGLPHLSVTSMAQNR